MEKQEQKPWIPESIAEIILMIYFSNKSLPEHLVKEVQVWLVDNNEREDVSNALEKIWTRFMGLGAISPYGKYISLESVLTGLAEAKRNKDNRES